MIDFHSHILPEIDDGSENVEESLKMLACLKSQGVTTVVATPHYKGQCSVEEFLNIRKASYEKLLSAIGNNENKYPKILLGAEVAVESCIENMSEINALCIEGTNFLLVEMPMKNWVSHIFDSLYLLSTKQRVSIIIAHVERYYCPFVFGKKRKRMNNNNNIFRLVHMQYIMQVTASSLKYSFGRKLLKKLVDNEAVVVFGTDCHNMSDRKPDMEVPMKYVAKKYGADFANQISFK